MDFKPKYGTAMEKAFEKSGIDVGKLSKDNPYKPLYVEQVRVPEELKIKIKAVLNDFAGLHLSMPFIHITVDKIKKGENVVSTGFVDNIESVGFSINTNGSTFMTLERGELPTVASPEYLAQNPEIFIEGIYLILKKYLHHGIRTNKVQLGHGFKTGSLLSKGEGMPVVIVLDRSSVKMKPGRDEDEHFVLRQRVQPENIMGKINLADIQTEIQEDVLYVSEQVIDVMEDYIKKFGNRSRDQQ
ncbi:MAG: hypothetical protein Q8O46_04000 [bacterium]|nr:hypothetical protein [bacterium]